MRIAPPDIFAARLTRLRTLVAQQGLGALLVTSPANIAYLTGFFATAGVLLVTGESLRLLVDGRYATVAADRARDWPAIEPVVLPTGASYDQVTVEHLRTLRGARVGFDPEMSVRRYKFVIGRLADESWPEPLVEAPALVEELRAVKDDWEVGRLREGAGRLSEVAKCILLKVLAGRSESELAGIIELGLRRAGFERPAFDTIVASGPQSALPHARPSGRVLAAGDLVVLDFGGVLDGYCTDLTRTVAVGAPANRQRQLVAQVVEAQAAAFAAVAPGAPPGLADQAAREVLERHGIGEAFTHGTGHGLGLEIHELPRISRPRAPAMSDGGSERVEGTGEPTPRVESPLAPGMVITLEPGVYFPGWGGVRIEDDVLVTPSGAEWLTDVPREI